jgi:hypothetical protein
MFARKFLNQLEAHADQLTNEFTLRIARSERCGELLKRVPPEDHEQSMRRLYMDMAEWLVSDHPSINADHYVAFGVRRAQQHVPFSELLAAVCAARQYFWEYVERETLLDEPADFWGGVKLLHLLDSFFDSALYFASIGHQKATGELNSTATQKHS